MFMHELGIAQNVLGIITEEAVKRNARAKAVKLGIGKMSGIVPESLEFILSCIAKDTLADGIEITINMIEPVMVCNTCDHQFNVPELEFFCPKCGGGDCKIIEGKDLIIETITLEDDNGA